MTHRIAKILLKKEFYGHCISVNTWSVATSSGLMPSLSNQLARLRGTPGAVTPLTSPHLTSGKLFSAPKLMGHPVCKHSLLFIAGLIWNIFGFETNLKSKALFSGRVTPFLFNSTKVESALKQGSLKPAAALLLGFQLKIFPTEVFKILLKILQHFL